MKILKLSQRRPWKCFIFNYETFSLQQQGERERERAPGRGTAAAGRAEWEGQVVLNVSHIGFAGELRPARLFTVAMKA